MLSATCHCGALRITVPRRPETLTNCNCSICRRYGALWAYYPKRDVQISGAVADRAEYVWGDRMLRFGRCARCGCVTHWAHIDPAAKGKMGVNARNFDPEEVGPVQIRRLDGAKSWKYLD